jgi:hypothetical protein
MPQALEQDALAHHAGGSGYDCLDFHNSRIWHNLFGMEKPDLTTVEEFRQQRLESWKRIPVPLFVLLVSMIFGFFYCIRVESASVTHVNICILTVAIGAAAYVRLIFVWVRQFRCPRCERGLTSFDAPFPRSCPHCGVRVG